MQRFLRFVIFSLGMLQIALLFCAWEEPAYGYVDPGSGFVVLQVLGSMAAGAAFYLRHKLRRVLSVFGKKEAGTAEHPPAANPAQTNTGVPETRA